jgi:hypothetical protein
VLPVPYPAQTITIRRCDGLRLEGDIHRKRPDIDNTTTKIKAKTSIFVPFEMPAFSGQHETIELRFGDAGSLRRHHIQSIGRNNLLHPRAQGCGSSPQGFIFHGCGGQRHSPRRAARSAAQGQHQGGHVLVFVEVNGRGHEAI